MPASMRDLRDLITTVRAVESDPDVLQMCRNLAAEMLVSGADYEEYNFDPLICESAPTTAAPTSETRSTRSPRRSDDQHSSGRSSRWSSSKTGGSAPGASKTTEGAHEPLWSVDAPLLGIHKPQGPDGTLCGRRGRTAVRPEPVGSALQGSAASAPRVSFGTTGENAAGSRIERAGHEDHPRVR